MDKKVGPTRGYYEYIHSPMPFLHAPQQHTLPDVHSKHKHASRSHSSGKSITRSILGNQVPGTSFTQAMLDGNTKKAHKALQHDAGEEAPDGGVPSPTKPKKRSLTARIREGANESDNDSIASSSRVSKKTSKRKSKSKSKKASKATDPRSKAKPKRPKKQASAPRRRGASASSDKGKGVERASSDQESG